MTKIGKHLQVFEYDGAFKCIKCQKSWGALPGKPEMPEKCKLSETSKRIMEIEKEVGSLKQEESWLLQKP